MPQEREENTTTWMLHTKYINAVQCYNTVLHEWTLTCFKWSSCNRSEDSQRVGRGRLASTSIPSILDKRRRIKWMYMNQCWMQLKILALVLEHLWDCIPVRKKKRWNTKLNKFCDVLRQATVPPMMMMYHRSHLASVGPEGWRMRERWFVVRKAFIKSTVYLSSMWWSNADKLIHIINPEEVIRRWGAHLSWWVILHNEMNQVVHPGTQIN